MSVVPFRTAGGSFLCSVDLYRMADGEIRATLRDMPAHVIEAEDTITARFGKAAHWCLYGSLDLIRQAVRFDDEHRLTTADNEDSPA